SRGVDALSMRDLARQAGVSHGAPAHHFGDRRGLLTALATDGFQRLATILEPSVTAEHFDQTAVAYVRFAATHPGHFDVMFRDRKSTRLNSSHVSISYAVFCLKKKNRNRRHRGRGV